jgi:hypothetical protein
MIVGAMGCGPANKDIRLTQGEMQGIKKIAVIIEQKHNFEVIHSRAKANAGAAAMFGLVGAAVASGIDEGADKDKVAAVASAVQDVCCPAIFIGGLKPLLESTRFDKIYIVPDASQKVDLSDYDAVVTFTIDRWGLRLVERETESVSAFVEMDVKMVRAKDKKTIWDQREVIVGDRRENFMTYKTNGEMLRNELRDTIKKAGAQMANALVYQ